MARAGRAKSCHAEGKKGWLSGRGGGEAARGGRGGERGGEIARISQIMLTGGVIRDHTGRFRKAVVNDIGLKERERESGSAGRKERGGWHSCVRISGHGSGAEIIVAPNTYPGGACRSRFRAGTEVDCSRPPPSGKTWRPSPPAPPSPSRPRPCCSPSAPPGTAPGAGSSTPPPRSSAGGTPRPPPPRPPPPGSCPLPRSTSPPRPAFQTRTCGSRSAKTSWPVPRPLRLPPPRPPTSRRPRMRRTWRRTSLRRRMTRGLAGR